MTTASSFALAAPSRPVASTNEPERSTSSETFGRLSARDRYLILADDPVADGTTEDRIQLILDGLSKPLVGVVDGTASTGYRMSSISVVSAFGSSAIGSAATKHDRSAARSRAVVAVNTLKMVVNLTAMLTAGYFENGRDRGYLRPGLDCAATARP
jgi:hypothetical protein